MRRGEGRLMRAGDALTRPSSPALLLLLLLPWDCGRLLPLLLLLLLLPAAAAAAASL